MKFVNLMDLLQVFVNEYCSPGNNVLIVCETYLEEIKKLFNFINCETFFVSKTVAPGIDFFIVDNNDLPFEERSFDLVIDLTGNSFFKFVKKHGTYLINGEIINGNEFYQLNATTFTVLQG